MTAGQKRAPLFYFSRLAAFYATHKVAALLDKRPEIFHNFICMIHKAASSQICDAVHHGQLLRGHPAIPDVRRQPSSEEETQTGSRALAGCEFDFSN